LAKSKSSEDNAPCYSSRYCFRIKKLIFFFLIFITACYTPIYSNNHFFYLENIDNLKTILLKHQDYRKHNFYPKHYAVLIGGNTEDRHRNNISLAYQVLLESGYNSKNIFILDSEGGDPSIFPISAQSNIESIDLLFNYLSNSIKSSDSLVIYMTGHGNKDSHYLLNNGQNIEKGQFIRYLNNIHPDIGIIITDFCYWGTIKEPNLQNFIFISATIDSRTSLGTSFGKIIWKIIRNNPNYSINDIYAETYEHDMNSQRNDGNIPNISFISKNPKNYNIKGEFIP